MATFCERYSDWNDYQFTPCRPFAKGPRFINLVMTFILHPLFHYNSIIESRARFLLSLLEHLTIDFPSHFILSIIDVHLDSTSRDKLIFHSTITRILCHFSVPFPSSDHFSVICSIDYATVKRSEVSVEAVGFSSSSFPFSSIPFCSIHIRSLLFFGQCNSRRYHGATAVHGYSPKYTLYGVVSGERSCQSYYTATGVHGWLCF